MRFSSSSPRLHAANSIPTRAYTRACPTRPTRAYARASTCALFALVVIALGGCGQDPDPIVASAPPSAVNGDAGGSVVAGTCSAGQTEACTCLASAGAAPVTGTRGCSGGLWLGCTCGASAPVTVQEDCLAGRYEGNFSGFYSSGFAGGFPIPVVALDLSGKPGLAFTLLKSDSGDQEFATYTVSNGYLEGEADGAFPIKGVLTGTLDCKTKRFVGELDGSYSILLPLGLNEGTFKGPVSGEYDVATHSFKLGVWKVKESEDVGLAIVSEGGGDGDWDAMYVGP
jgi:hypothetical protein